MSTTTVQKHTKSGFTTLGIAITAVLIALSTLLTMFTKIPVPGIRGYFNVGDAVIMLAALLLGRKEGTLVGAIGPALADLLLGYAVFVPITFLVKGIEGFLVATIYGKKKSFSSALLATIIGGVIIVVGYFVAESFVFAGILTNTIQAVMSVLISMLLYTALRKIPFVANLSKQVQE
nr:ECF transporter S component [uncultured Oribacterium sp.]